MSIPVITVAQMREWEKVTWADGQTEEAVMRRVGQALARHVEQITQPNDVVVVLAGKGHNGDDACFAAEYLSGRQAKVLRIADPEAAGKALASVLEQRPALIIDGLFGIGLNRPLASRWVNLIRQVNQAKLPVLSVDVPSGLNADTGLPLDDAIRATWTYTLGAVKDGLLKPTAWPFVGRLVVEPEIGLAPYPFETEIRMIEPEDFVDFPPPRPLGGHKGTFGHLAVVAGSVGYHGAAVLAARGAQRAQPGLITLYTDERVYEPVAQQLQSVMVHPWTPDTTLPPTCTAVLFGPGLASPQMPEGVKRLCQQLWQESPHAVLADASGLDWLVPGPCLEHAVRVITPHPGEAARMLKKTSGDVQADRLGAVRELSKRFGGCHVVLKGHQTLIGSHEFEAFVNCSGNPHLAQGGSGDLLAGFLGGLLAQPALQSERTRTLCYGVWQHGAAADLLQASRPNWTVEELAGVLGSVPARPRPGPGSGSSPGA